jgi:hypothetical protein
VAASADSDDDDDGDGNDLAAVAAKKKISDKADAATAKAYEKDFSALGREELDKVRNEEEEEDDEDGGRGLASGRSTPSEQIYLGGAPRPPANTKPKTATTSSAETIVLAEDDEDDAMAPGSQDAPVALDDSDVEEVQEKVPEVQEELKLHRLIVNETGNLGLHLMFDSEMIPIFRGNKKNEMGAKTNMTNHALIALGDQSLANMDAGSLASVDHITAMILRKARPLELITCFFKSGKRVDFASYQIGFSQFDALQDYQRQQRAQQIAVHNAKVAQEKNGPPPVIDLADSD